MTIKHHLSDELLMAYAAADLPEAFNLVIAAHLSMCDECRARSMAFDALGGAVIEDSTCEMSAGSLEACMARISELPQAQVPEVRRTDAVLPAPLLDYVGGGLEAVKWRSLGMGVRQAILRIGDRGASARLLYIPAGAAMPDHGHRGLELTLVLQGAFRDEADRFGRGDIEIADASVEHTPVAEAGADCICLAATQGALKFNALLPRLAQPFFRI
ncbi:MAG: ChrR family anti-sigma-E factor [Pseudotabrizicola sp.]|uniref:ChrR family anti-sigma-E factor n=1 Tax=Pseudotabrizicola sp. TaxID=2939647 RepID=UPI00271B4A9B|nr:ChrR family anti-sigma-E factor [Pseudotabrizicola sp.]MDO9639001.1 ChrR family anti-sigma-E factor [Pseudotabrizicola sp.]